MYNDPSGELFWFAALVPIIGKFFAAVVAGAIGGAIIGSALYLGQAFITGNFSWGGFAKSFFVGTLTGAISGGLGQVFSAAGFWATVGNGALAGAGSGGITSLINGTNFFEGLIKGAVIGGIVGGVSWGIRNMTNNKVTSDHGIEVDSQSQNNPSQSADANDAKETFNKNWKKAYESTENVKKTYLMKKGSIPSGYKVDPQTGAFIKDGNSYNGVARTTYASGETGAKALYTKIYLADSAYSSVGQLNYTMGHELGHAVINNNFGFNNEYNKIISEISLLDTQAHRAIQFTGQKFLNLNSWQSLGITGAYNNSFLGGIYPENNLIRLLKPLIIKIR
ncbi:hypothetical protein MTP09_08050 [Chryseobacterium suipulveris]|uniref:Uncharacterized protein n=1 Tax=Chryseobacterium suipulveris TaxID=2929800 RepID=A0ABY4BL02_9FLAO|nr:hypothetical protein [Chryseobacterium suipulveris]UOE39878.1 hypothetical protein MTP09_08050 [Chryseobacterium suipulveris]